MPSFVDVNKKEWFLKLDSTIVELVRTELVDAKGNGIDVAGADGSGLITICGDAVLLTRCLWLIVKDTSEARQGDGTKPGDFAKGLASGEVQEAAEQALREAVLNFTKPRLRDALSAVLTSQDKVTALQLEEVKARVQDPETQATIVEATRRGMLAQVDRIATWLSSAKGSPATAESPQSD